MEEDILNLIGRGEDNETEYLPSNVTPRNLSKVICSFANANGGFIALGVLENGNHIQGIDEELANVTLQKTRDLLSNVALDASYHRVRGPLSVFLIKVEKSSSLSTCHEGAFIREGESIRPMSVEEIKRASNQNSLDTEIIIQTLAEQTELIEKMKNEQASNNSLKSKAIDYLVGGLVGAILGALISG
ncbi:AlbA family DNA-binding domain-containing protein [Alteromonas lipotrueae]|uniref:AlbA family DNA-binding domain-containing protein n=1 Tax=Alteromonas lipotrueae TaxID=2803814 RepID=UPI001C447195|nr:RNA-binding domain-containing protein [Alteromonas lipotrueae]